MKPLILDFAEEPTRMDVDYSLIEYSEELNLTVFKSTQEPAIDILSLDTRTGLKSPGPTDSDRDFDTAVVTECHANLRTLLETRTITESAREGTDSD